MKPSSRDHRHRLKIAGDGEQQRHSVGMCVAFGLDRKIEKYQGT